jgi:hypothetical protein
MFFFKRTLGLGISNSNKRVCFSTSAINKLKGAWGIYEGFLHRRPVLTKAISSAAIAGLADYTCQHLEKSKSKRVSSVAVEDGDASKLKEESSKGNTPDIDMERTAVFSAILFFVGAFQHYYMGYLMKKIPGESFKVNAKRTISDQLIAVPVNGAILACGCYFNNTPDKRSIKLIKDKLRDDLPRVYMCDILVWCPCAFLTFTFVPPHLQVLSYNIVGFFWDIYISYEAAS